MDPDDRRLGRLGARITEALDEQDRSFDARRARERLLALPRPANRARQAVFVGLTLAAAAIAALLVTRPWSVAPLALAVDGKPNVDPQAFLNVPSDRPMDLAFSDGSQVRVSPGSGARILDLQSTGAKLVLERGRLHANVRHDVRTSWAVTAGPFSINVVGTEFDVQWDPAPGQLTVTVTRGRVLVSGGGVPSQAIVAGNTLTARLVEVGASFEVHPSAASAAATAELTRPEAEPSAPSPSTSSKRAEPAHTEPAASSTPEPARSAEAPRASSNEWRELAKQGRYREAVAAADSAGFQAQLASGSAADLLTLGNTARLAGALGRAEEAFLTLRQRFPRDPSRAVAAFSLGKIAFDQKNDAPSAARWFRTCVQEAPSGSLARESEGRLLESLQRMGDRSGTQNVAREYLARFPDGPHASLARAALAAGE